MKKKGKFTLLELPELDAWVEAQVVHRRISLIQEHHTWSPAYAHFRGANHFALMEGMEASHLGRGFAEIAQHFTTFPDGTVGVGRSLEKIPAGIKGANAEGICIEHLGNFDAGKDAMASAHETSIVRFNALLCRKFRLAPSTATIVYHHWYDLDTGVRTGGTGNTKTCPGTGFFGGNSVAAAAANFVPSIAAELARLAGAAGPPAPALAAPMYQAKVTADSLNVRDQPSSAGRIVGSLKKEAAVNVYAEQDQWRRIHLTEMSWVSGRYLKTV